jgi:2-amino-4-hydroxy-6-hydroxymethyldihydropteridine diphosphokinase
MIFLERAFISLGSNIEPEKHLPLAVTSIHLLGEIQSVSRVYQNPPIGSEGQPDFLNAAVLVHTPLGAAEIREQLRLMETSLGRVRLEDKFAPRTIDLDLCLLGDQIIETEELVLPDPGILKHAHLAIPLAELDPSFRHPITGEALGEIADRLRVGAVLQLQEDVSERLANLAADPNRQN